MPPVTLGVAPGGSGKPRAGPSPPARWGPAATGRRRRRRGAHRRGRRLRRRRRRRGGGGLARAGAGGGGRRGRVVVTVAVAAEEEERADGEEDQDHRAHGQERRPPHPTGCGTRGRAGGARGTRRRWRPRGPGRRQRAGRGRGRARPGDDRGRRGGGGSAPPEGWRQGPAAACPDAAPALPHGVEEGGSGWSWSVTGRAVGRCRPPRAGPPPRSPGQASSMVMV